MKNEAGLPRSLTDPRAAASRLRDLRIQLALANHQLLELEQARVRLRRDLIQRLVAGGDSRTVATEQVRTHESYEAALTTQAGEILVRDQLAAECEFQTYTLHILIKEMPPKGKVAE